MLCTLLPAAVVKVKVKACKSSLQNTVANILSKMGKPDKPRSGKKIASSEQNVWPSSDDHMTIFKNASLFTLFQFPIVTHFMYIIHHTILWKGIAKKKERKKSMGGYILKLLPLCSVSF